jgi:pyridoxamine 5'-phosphate oxidase
MTAMGDPRWMRAASGFHPDRTLERDDLLDDPIAQFLRWLEDAEAEGVPLPNAMAVATADAGGRPSVRHVLLRGLDARGFVFYTNRESRKGRELAENPNAALVFLWKELDRQVSVAGSVELVSDEESDAYFAERPRDAQLGAWASPQSSTLESRTGLEHRLADAEARFRGTDVPRPAFWGGYRVVPATIEFWQGRAFRLHDRFRYSRADAAATDWRVERLAP